MAEERAQEQRERERLEREKAEEIRGEIKRLRGVLEGMGEDEEGENQQRKYREYSVFN